MKLKRLLIISLSFCWLGSSSQVIKEIRPGSLSSITKIWENLNLSSKIHTGLVIYDLNKENWIFGYRDDQFFTPASCTKLLTMYTALRYLDDDITSAYYKVKDDTMMVWGGGDPGTLYPDIHGISPMVEFLKSTDKTIVFSNHHFKTERYGSGWSWDDYPEDYQCERTAFPIYGNRIWIDRFADSIIITPKYFEEITTIKPDTAEEQGRNEWGNSYFYNYDPSLKESHVAVPVSFFENDMRMMWSDATGKIIHFKDIPISGNVEQIKGTARDSLIKWMMYESDNFIAEQLILACAMKQTSEMNETDFIEKVIQGPLMILPDKIDWVDGSGLSRYNMITPRSLVVLLQQLIKQHGLDFVKSMLPAGGKSGTLITDYRGINGQPYVFAKSGTLRHMYCLTGILVTKSGKVLLFSWMNNEIPGRIAPLKQSMEYFFTYLRDNY